MSRSRAKESLVISHCYVTISDFRRSTNWYRPKATSKVMRPGTRNKVIILLRSFGTSGHLKSLLVERAECHHSKDTKRRHNAVLDPHIPAISQGHIISSSQQDRPYFHPHISSSKMNRNRYRKYLCPCLADCNFCKCFLPLLACCHSNGRILHPTSYYGLNL